MNIGSGRIKEQKEDGHEFCGMYRPDGKVLTTITVHKSNFFLLPFLMSLNDKSIIQLLWYKISES